MTSLAPEQLLSRARYQASHPFADCLSIPPGRNTSRFDKVKGAGIFRGQSRYATPTYAEVIAEMKRIAGLYGILAELPKNFEQVLVNRRQQPGSISERHAYLLAASFGLSTEAFAAPAECFENVLDFAQRLRDTPVRMSDETYDVLLALVSRSADSPLLSLAPTETRAPGREKFSPAPLLPCDEQISVAIDIPPAFQDGCNILLLERDANNDVFCYCPSCWLPVRPTGFSGARVTLPADGAIREQLSVGVKGRSTFVVVLTKGPDPVAPAQWGFDLRNIRGRLRPLLDVLAQRAPETWRIASAEGNVV